MLAHDTKASAFDQWRRAYLSYATLAGLDLAGPVVQRIALISNLSLPLQTTLHHTLGISRETDLTVENILDRLAKYFRQQTSIVVDRLAFMRRNQAEGETFDNFYACLLYTSPSPRDKRQSRMPSSA